MTTHLSPLLMTVEELCVRTGLPRSRVQREFREAWIPAYRRYQMDVVQRIINDAREGRHVPSGSETEHLADRL